MDARYERPTEWWVRICGYGISLRDHRRIPPYFSERFNGQHGIKSGRYLHVGPFCLSLLPRRRP